MMKALLDHLQQYLQQILHIDLPKPQRWAGASALPRHVLDSYALYQTSLLGAPCLVVLLQSENEPAISMLKKHLQLIVAKAGWPVLYVQEGIRARTRQNLIEHQISFAIPGRQLYLPPMGIDLREHFQAQAKAQGAALSPAAQMIWVGSQLKRWSADLSATALAKCCGYSDMTLSRVRRELAVHPAFDWPPTPLETWQTAPPYLRSPVQRTIWLRNPCDYLQKCPLAGLAALAKRSMLAPPEQDVRAIDAAAWRVLRQLHPDMQEVDADTSDALALELWKYDPVRLVGDAMLVDPWSLFASLTGHAEERVAMALDDMMKELDL